jgi:hypothetical protein
MGGGTIGHPEGISLQPMPHLLPCRYTEFYPIWNRSTLAKLSNPSAWQRRAYTPDNKLRLRAQILSIK